jgi:hypothetical protein
MPVSARLHHGALLAGVSDVVDAGIDLLPHYAMAALPMLDGQERPMEVPAVRRRLRAEGIRAKEHRGVMLLEPGDVDQLASIGLFSGNDEVLFMAEWNDEFESFPGRIGGDAIDFNDVSPLGLEEWMFDAGCVLAIGDGRRLNFATLDIELATRLRARFRPAR